MRYIITSQTPRQIGVDAYTTIQSTLREYKHKYCKDSFEEKILHCFREDLSEDIAYIQWKIP